jgi:hypothetical protein
MVRTRLPPLPSLRYKFLHRAFLRTLAALLLIHRLYPVAHGLRDTPAQATNQSASYSIPAGIVAVRGTLYLAGGFSTLLDQEAVPIVSDGANGSSGIVIDLSNQAHTVPTDSDGANGNFTGCATTATIYSGGTDVSAAWSFASPSVTGGISGTVSNSNRTYTVSAMSADTGTVTFSASKTGETTRTVVFTVSKAKGGVSYQIEPSAGAINKNNAGDYSPSSINFSAYKLTTNSRSAFSCYFYIERQTALNGAWSLVYQSSTPQTSYSYSIPSGTYGVRGSIYLSAGQYLDVEAVPVVFDGQRGQRGSRQFVFSGTAWSDTAAWDGIVTATAGNPVLTDLVTIANAATSFSVSKFCTANTTRPGSWVQPDSYINGNLLVTGTVGADGLVANSITAAQIASNTITTSNLNFTPVQSSNVVASINASAEGIRIASNKIYIDGSVSFSSGYDPSQKITSGGAATDINNNATTINGGKITTGTLTANAIGTGTISAATITLDGTNGVIKSSTYPSSGFYINGAGAAYLYSAVIKGAARSSNWNGSVDPATGNITPGTATVGWAIDNNGNADFNTVMVRTEECRLKCHNISQCWWIEFMEWYLT